MQPSFHATNGHQGNTLFVNRREWNNALVRAKTEAAVIALWQSHGSQFSCVNVCTALISFTKSDLTSNGERCICSMLHHYVENAESIRLRDAASTVDSLAKLHFSGAEIDRVKEAVFVAIAHNAAHTTNFFTKPLPASLVQLLQNFASDGKRGDTIFNATMPLAISCLADFTAAQVVQMVFFCSKKGYRSEIHFQEIEKKIIRTVHQYSSSDLSHIAAAFSSLELGTSAFFKACYCKIKSALKGLDSAAIESCLIAFGQSDEKLALSKALETVIISNKELFNPDDFVAVLAACSTLQIWDDDFLQDMEHEALARLEQFTPGSLALLATSFAKMHAGSYCFFSSLESRVLECIKQFESRDLVMLYHAYSISRLADGKFLSKIESTLEHRGNLAPQDVATLIWSMLLARSIEEKYLAVLIHSLNETCEMEIPKTIHPQMLLEIETMIKADAPELARTMSAPLLHAIELAKQQNLAARQERSSLQIEVEEAIERYGYTFTSKQLLDGVLVDIFIDSEKLAIEVCEKSSYYRTAPNELVATSLIKKRLLESKGYKLLHLPYFDWVWSKTQQDLYLQELFSREYHPIADLK